MEGGSRNNTIHTDLIHTNYGCVCVRSGTIMKVSDRSIKHTQGHIYQQRITLRKEEVSHPWIIEGGGGLLVDPCVNHWCVHVYHFLAG